MKILFVSPAPKGKKRHKNLHIPQLSLPILAGLTPPEHEIEIIEEPWDKINFDKKYDLVGITTMTATAPRAYEISAMFRERGIKTILGGIHPTTLPDESIRYANSVVIGEAENIWSTVIKDFQKNDLRKFYKGEFPLLENSVLPRRDLIRRKAGAINLAPVETTRGCPYNCDFCSVTKLFGSRPRHKPIKEVIEDIATIKEKNLIFLDDNITANKQYARELFKELKYMDKTWVGQSSINVVKDRELLKLAAESGCCAFFVGLESVSAKGINRYHKNLESKEEIKEAIKIFQDAGILIYASLIFGFDNDDPAVFEQTVEFLIESKVAFVQLVLLTPFPGTKIFNDLQKDGRIFSYDWSKYDNLNLVFEPLGMNTDQVLRGFHWARRKFYAFPSIIKRFWANKRYPIFYSSLNLGSRHHTRNRKMIIGSNNDSSF
ncbi:MAG: B12-binding domain-containing radical SAM protein [Candidatus Thorarchaeota archaeon]